MEIEEWVRKADVERETPLCGQQQATPSRSPVFPLSLSLSSSLNLSISLASTTLSLCNSQWVRYTFHSIYLPFPISIRFGPPITQHGPGSGNVRFLHPPYSFLCPLCPLESSSLLLVVLYP